MRTWLVVIVLLRAGAAHADVDLDACLGDSRDAIRRAVIVELGDASAVHASIACDGPVVVLSADDPATGTPVRRRFDLGLAMGPMGPRLIALALVELIADTRSTPPPHALQLADAPPAATVVARSEPGPAFRATLAAGTLWYSADRQTLAGLGIRLATRTRFGGMIDAQVHHGSRETGLGEVATDVVGVGGAGTMHLGSERASIDLGAGVRAGAVRLGGTPMAGAHGTVMWSRWAGVFASSALALAINQDLALDATVEAGQVVAPVHGRVDDSTVVRIDAAWVAVQVGVTVHL